MHEEVRELFRGNQIKNATEEKKITSIKITSVIDEVMLYYLTSVGARGRYVETKMEASLVLQSCI